MKYRSMLFGAMSLVACSGGTGSTSPSTEVNSQGSGGQSLSSAGGNTLIAPATGGVLGSTIPAAGGASNTNTTATSTSGTSTTTGGTLGTGGSKANGGTTALGGTPSTGGTSSTTGTKATGGASSTGGTKATGGTATGGSTGTGLEGAIFVSPDGNDNNPGTLTQPYLTLAKAVTRAAPNVTISLRGGTHRYSTMVTLSASGTANAPIVIQAYGSEKPVLDFATQPYGSSNRAILLTGNYWQIRGVEICNAGDNGIKVEGSHNRIERCVFHHNGDSGIQLGFAHETVNPNGENCAYNEIVNCDSYLNFDFDTKGGDADGFACKMHAGKGNKFIGCRAWHNSDDGWDLYETDWPVEITNCWTWHNGDQTDFDALYLAKMGTKMSSYSGNGNGFKVGGNGTGGNSVGTHVVTGCVAFDNNFRSKKGFDQNSHQGGVVIRNCVAWGNGYNYMFEDNANSGFSNEFYNNVSFDAKTTLGFEFSAGSILKNNSWQLPVTANSADFSVLTEAGASAPRQADGNLPNNGFARLVSGSDLIDRGLDLGLPFSGSAPDLGAYETP